MLRSTSQPTCEVRRDLNRVICTWNRDYSVLLLLLLLLVVLGLLNIMSRRLILRLLVAALTSALCHILLARSRRLPLSRLLLLLLSRLCRSERNLNVRSRYR